MKLFNLNDEVVLITGVNGQLGSEYAKCLLNNGAKRVIGLDLKKSKVLDSLYDPDRFSFYEVDITQKKSLENVSKEIEEISGSPTVLINNAGIDSSPDSSLENASRFEDYTEDQWDKVLDVNLKGTFLTCQVFGSLMAKRKKGSIINISSIYGMVSPDQSLYEYRRQKGEEFYKPVAYSASKSGIMNLTKYLAVYWASSSVRVNTLTLAGVYNNQDDEFLRQYNSRIPLGRMANIDDYNGAIIFLSSPASQYMTGSNLIVDGGWTAI